jgi:hypothetical protein
MNEMEQDNVEVVQDVCGFCWKIEQFHCEIKQLAGLENYQCRKEKTVYQVKHELSSDYLRQQPKSPTVQMRLA